MDHRSFDFLVSRSEPCAIIEPRSPRRHQVHLCRDIRKRSRRYRLGGRGWSRISILQPGNDSHHTDRDEAARSYGLQDRRRRRNGRKRKIEAGNGPEKRPGEKGDNQGGRSLQRCERRLRFHVELQQRATDVPWHEPQDGDTRWKATETGNAELICAGFVRESFKFHAQTMEGR